MLHLQDCMFWHRHGHSCNGDWTSLIHSSHHLGSSSKCIKAGVLASIITLDVLKFFKRNILARYKVLQAVVKDNGMHFIYKKGWESYWRSLKVEHLQTNNQAETTNWVLVMGLKRRLEEDKGNCVDELPHMLWAYCTTHSRPQEKPFMTHVRVEASILVEIEELS